jgi:hypothetical protein
MNATFVTGGFQRTRMVETLRCGEGDRFESTTTMSALLLYQKYLVSPLSAMLNLPNHHFAPKSRYLGIAVHLLALAVLSQYASAVKLITLGPKDCRV